MSDDPRPAARPLLAPLVGLLAVGNVVFLLLWLLTPLARGPAAAGTGRRIELSSGGRAVRLLEGVDRDKALLGFEARVSDTRFEALIKGIEEAVRSRAGSEHAQAFFDSAIGQDATPAVSLRVPRETGGPLQLDVYALDVRRQLCYCRLGDTREVLAVPAPRYEEVLATISALAGGVAGRFPVPAIVALEPAATAQLARLEAPLVVSVVSPDPVHSLQQAVIRRPKSLRVWRPDPSTITGTLELPDDMTLVRGLADALTMASERVVVNHLDFVGNAKEVAELAKAVERPENELSGAMILHLGSQARVIPASGFFEGEGEARQFAGCAVLARALDGLLVDRGLVCFAAGHGERSIDDAKGPGLRRVADVLRAAGFQVRAHDLARDAAVPDDCQVLVLAGPLRPYGEQADAALRKYVADGGRMAVLLDPPDGAVPLAKLLATHGVTVPAPKTLLPRNMPDLPENVVKVDLDRSVPLVRDWPRDEIMFVTACGLAVADPAVSVAQTFKLVPSQKSACVAAVSGPAEGAKGAKLLVVGDVCAFTNNIIDPMPGNGKFLTDALTWLAR
jgi:hypothetical protein